jgi:hypothetical protein
VLALIVLIFQIPGQRLAYYESEEEQAEPNDRKSVLAKYALHESCSGLKV